MKTILYKSILASVIGFTAFSFNSCTDLDETIYSNIAAEKYEFSEKDAASMFAPVYSNLRNLYWGWNGYCDIQDESSDLWCTPYRIGIGWGDLYVSMHKHEFHSQIGHIWTEWNYAYSGINACNKLLADEAVQTSESAVAQLRAYRALYYYVLFDLFRNIPLDTTYDHPAGWLPEQSAPQETWDFIISELNDIKGKCGVDNGMGQINNATVNMLLAKMYLNHNAWFNSFSDNSWYGKAIDEINEIIQTGKYSLAANYSDCFKEDISKCSEVIFGIPAAIIMQTNGYTLQVELYGTSTVGQQEEVLYYHSSLAHTIVKTRATHLVGHWGNNMIKVELPLWLMANHLCILKRYTALIIRDAIRLRVDV